MTIHWLLQLICENLRYLVSFPKRLHLVFLFTVDETITASQCQVKISVTTVYKALFNASCSSILHDKIALWHLNLCLPRLKFHQYFQHKSTTLHFLFQQVSCPMPCKCLLLHQSRPSTFPTNPRITLWVEVSNSNVHVLVARGNAFSSFCNDSLSRYCCNGWHVFSRISLDAKWRRRASRSISLLIESHGSFWHSWLKLASDTSQKLKTHFLERCWMWSCQLLTAYHWT